MGIENVIVPDDLGHFEKDPQTLRQTWVGKHAVHKRTRLALCFYPECDEPVLVTGLMTMHDTGNRRHVEVEMLACDLHKWRLHEKVKVGERQEEIKVGVVEPPALIDPEVEVEEEQLFLVCGCGEAFDSLVTANNHVCDDLDADGKSTYQILPESEAF